MPDNVNNSNNQDDIINNLLVKDELGTLHSLSGSNKPQNSISDDKKSVPETPEVKEMEPMANSKDKIVTAPVDDNFKEHPMASGKAADKSELVFHPEDKEQISSVASTIPIDDSKKYSVEKIIDKIVDKQQLQLDDENKKLFTNAIFDFFRNRKNAVIVRQFIQGRVSSNGQKIDGIVLDNVLSVIKDLKNKIDNSGGLVVKADEFLKQAVKKEETTGTKDVAETKENIEEEPNNAPEVVLSKESSTSNQPSAQEEVIDEGGELIVPKDNNDGGNEEMKKFKPPVLDNENNEVDNTPSTSEDLKPEEVAESETASLAELINQNEEDEMNEIKDKDKVGPEDVENILNSEINPEPEETLSIGNDDQSAIEKSLAEIQGIMPEAKKKESDEDDLLKDIAVDEEVSDIGIQSPEKNSPQEDLHDVGQLMMEDDKDPVTQEEEKPAEMASDIDSAIKKIKPQDIMSESKEDLDEEEVKDKTVDNGEAVQSNVLSLNSVADSEDKVDISTQPEKAAEIVEDKNIAEDVGSNQTAAENAATPKNVQKESTSLPRVIRPGQTFTVRPNLNDVRKSEVSGQKPQHVLTGPVDELSNMTLKNFRFLGANAEDRVNKVLEKISILEQDSFTKKAAGIKGWRQSPVYQMYLKLGADSMAEGKDISVLINEKKAAGEEILDIEEFSAISDLNKSLRF